MTCTWPTLLVPLRRVPRRFPNTPFSVKLSSFARFSILPPPPHKDTIKWSTGCCNGNNPIPPKLHCLSSSIGHLIVCLENSTREKGLKKWWIARPGYFRSQLGTATSMMRILGPSRQCRHFRRLQRIQCFAFQAVVSSLRIWIRGSCCRIRVLSKGCRSTGSRI